ncbi:hypothetical protein [Luteolibacter luteus]|uniref:Uncharacterized protein n=1 Tax=Luteolibacter luteus TaxID=2728835 RepID=A0A858RCK4_9BACT|nr:hypothetical protein [Luteolibacter luteus]QJE94381.1 hypothetical protein HHL09_00795 [Luteolibacter luteus]
MAVQPNKRSILLGAGGLLILALGGFVAWERAGAFADDSGQDQRQASLESAAAPAKSDKDRSKPARSDREFQQLADKWYQEIVEKHPELAINFKDVPDDQNGFLQLLNFTDRFGQYGADGLPLPENIRAILDGKQPWDPAAMANWLEENRALFDEIVAIGLLPDQSVKGIDMDRLKFFSARLPYDCNRLLLAHARMAMEGGDEAGALQSTRAALGISDHLGEIEMPSLLSETVSLLVGQSTRKTIFDHMAAAEGSDLAAWQELLTRNQHTPEDLARVFLGEWHHSTRSFLLPALLGDPRSLPMMVDNSGREPEPVQKIHDPDAVLAAQIAYFTQITANMKESTVGEIPGLSVNPVDTTGLSKDGAAVLDMLFKGSAAWSKGWTRSQTDAAILNAALQAASGGEVPLEPYTGKPFIIDQEAGTIRVPEDPWFESMNYQPVKIPVLKQR